MLQVALLLVLMSTASLGHHLGGSHSEHDQHDYAHQDHVHQNHAHQDHAHHDYPHQDHAHHDYAHHDHAHEDHAHNDYAHHDHAHQTHGNEGFDLVDEVALSNAEVATTEQPEDLASGSVEKMGPFFGVVVDACKYETKVRVYRYGLIEGPIGIDDEMPVPKISDMELITMNTTPMGLEEFVDRLEEVREILAPLIEFASQSIVPSELRAQTPIMVLATAAFRSLPHESNQKLFDHIATLLNDTTFNPFSYSKSKVKVISGEEEAVYSWVALNYLLGFFDTDMSANQSAGMMDMNEFSTQIAFYPEINPYADAYPVVVGGKKYILYAHSFMDLGIESIERKVAEKLAEEGSMDDPCSLDGDLRFYELSNGTLGFLFGTSMPETCLTYLRPLIFPEVRDLVDCQLKPCRVLTEYEPPLPNIDYYAIGDFVDTPETLNLVTENITALDITKLFRTGVQFSQGTLEDAIDRKIGADTASSTALMSLFTPTLLQGYGIKPDTTVHFTRTVNGQMIEWPMGALIVDISEDLHGIESDVSPRRDVTPSGRNP